MADAPTDSSSSPLEATVARCIECGSNADDPTADDCWNCGESGLMERFHVTETPLGYADDDDYLIVGRGGVADRWEYLAAEPV